LEEGIGIDGYGCRTGLYFDISPDMRYSLLRYTVIEAIEKEM